MDVVLVLIKRLPDQDSKSNFVDDLEQVINKYEKFIDLRLIGFPLDYSRIFSNCINRYQGRLKGIKSSLPPYKKLFSRYIDNFIH